MRTALARRPGISERAMFGGFCWMLNGNMLCGVEVGRFMFRVGKELETKALAKPGAEPIVFSGRRMGGLVWVNEAACRGHALASWIAFARVSSTRYRRDSERTLVVASSADAGGDQPSACRHQHPAGCGRAPYRLASAPKDEAADAEAVTSLACGPNQPPRRSGQARPATRRSC
jgi:hypothetical protein